jgi:aspartate/methionine/tyrosine aminotransferase
VIVSRAVTENLQKASWIRRMFEEGARLKQERGADKVFDFTLGNPEIEPPPAVLAAARRVLDSDARHLHAYMPNAGHPRVREAVAQRLRGETGLPYTANHVIMTVGAGAALNTVLKAVLDPGDEVLTVAPFFAEYTFYAENHGGKLIVVPPKADLTPDVAKLEAAITPRTRAILVNSPANPTGTVYPRDLLHAVAELAVRHDLLLISDETYAALTYGDIRTVSPASFPGLRDRTVSIYSFSKEYAMTGWRIGYLTGPASMLEVMAPVQEAMASCVNAATQRAALAALRGPQDAVEAMRRAYQRRRDLVVERLGRIAGVRCPRPDGAFYAFPDVRAITRDTARLAERLLFDHRVVVSPGEAFGPRSAGFLRLSYACSDEDLAEGLTRLEAGLAAARRG